MVEGVQQGPVLVGTFFSVVASLLGHSRQPKKKHNTRCVLVHKHRWNTWAAHPA